ncbi:phospho-sugar mutase [Corynebacterium sp. sy039]|uniref:phospho-sugar mutase n=1 Tax=Corynebacterium sp. sy039 TaxID=2599641 RepID=UPI0011B71C8A|nr:phospho-sugar mutase [Corynebacterium sp. sy039]QDZ43046.1 phospho-sugar mutase [Corynebacterium sp. sy039]
MTNEQLLNQAQRWAEHDPDPRTRAEILELIRTQNVEELRGRFAGPLEFGTAGLRGALGAGESRMNTAVVLRATYGLVSWLKENVSQQPRVVLGCDARHGSAQFHRDAAAVISLLGGTPVLLEPRNPTPVTAHAVRALSADAGIMITASHNPPQDNGYKVYLGGASAGSQIIPPVDTEIAAHIAQAPHADEIHQRIQHHCVHAEYPQIDYEAAVLAKAELNPPQTAAALRIVATAMHGVGGATLTRVLARAGFDDVILVSQQAYPDPDFPTVSFPNPEEPGALDLAIRTATQHDADIILALDPDADRCAVALKHNGQWRQLNGNELGSILGHYAAQTAQPGQKLASSIVSSRLLAHIAAAHGLDYEPTLTGFKWISRVPHLAFGYEEAIGFCCQPDVVRDKDGISAALYTATIAARLKEQNRTLVDVLDELAHEHGLYHSDAVSVRSDNQDELRAILDTLRDNPPQTIGADKVTTVIDLARAPEERGALEHLPQTNCLIFETQHQDRIIIRPSGTEPKVKCYLEVFCECLADQPVPWQQAYERMSSLKAQVQQLLSG